MKKVGLLHIVLLFGLMFILIANHSSAIAQCAVKEIGGSNTLVPSNQGSIKNDLIICEDGDEATATVKGLDGNDTILIYDGTPSIDIEGDGASVSGNDTIVIFASAAVDLISGDRSISTSSIPGDDQIAVHGTANKIYGDDVTVDTIVDRGGDDAIDVYGKVLQSVIGDGIFPNSNQKDMGGDDVITVHRYATVAQDIFGDYLNSQNELSHGGSDHIIINGTVQDDVFGDYIVAGGGGSDTIVVSITGKVGTSGNESHIFGDFRSGAAKQTYGNSDNIGVYGEVYGDVYGDYMKDSGGKDVIVVGDRGIVHRNIFGDFLTSDDATNHGDRITIMGQVKGNVEGDGHKGTGERDYISIESFGEVDGNVSGDGTFKDSGNADGDEDHIVIKGRVGGDVYGDDVDGHGDEDSIVIQGRHEFHENVGHVNGNLVGDLADLNGAKDYITTTRFSQVDGGVYGDKVGGKGGDDNIQIDGNVGTNSSETGVYGDKTAGDGGDDFIHIEKHGQVFGEVVGDDADGKGGSDLMWIDGLVTGNVMGDKAKNGNAKDQIAVRQTGVVNQSVAGDGTQSNKNGGWDVMNIIGGTVKGDFGGDVVGGNGGNDFMAIRMNGLVGGRFIGDEANKDGGDDTMSLINGIVEGDMIGDSVNGDGGNDKMNVLVSGTVKGNLVGDLAGIDKFGGDDSIFVSGKVDGKLIGDHQSKNAFAGKDTIQTSPSAVIGKGIIGDNAKGAGKNDIFKINGKINANGVKGDGVSGKGGNDTISVFSLGDVKGNVIGDDANGAGGNDTILVDGGGKVTGNVWGDFSKGKGGNDNITIEGTITGNVEGDRHKNGSSANGGNDTILVEKGGLVQGNVFGDNSPGNGGDDKIEIRGKVNGNVLGDNVGGSGGKDVIRIFASGVVGGSVCGFNLCNNNPGDNVVFLDEDVNPNLDSADTIIIAGKVLGNVIAGSFYGSNADDTVVVIEGAEIGGTVYAGDETEGDTFIYVENIINEEKTVDDVVDSITEQDVSDGKVTINGETFTLDDVEAIDGAVGQIACFGKDYRMNKTSDGCSARSGAEKEAIQWHRDNPGNDGRLPGLESCAVYTHGDAMRVYQIMNGVEGELVAELWGDVLSDAPATNELFGQTADGNVSLYHLASGELQLECKNLVDGKIQVRVMNDLAGTVTNAYDKS